VSVLADSAPPLVVPILSVVCPGVPDQIFFTSIEPCFRVFVKVQTTTSPVDTEIELPAPGVIEHRSEG